MTYPRAGWLADYMNYAGRGLQSPRLYHLICGLFCVGAIAGPETRILGAGDPVFLNLNICLVGPSGFAQKSRTLERARQVLIQARQGVLLSDEFSREKLFMELHTESHRVFLWREFGKLLQIAKRDYMAGLLEFLTELHDCPPELTRSLRRETYIIKRPYVSTLTASTPEWLFPHMSGLDILAGYFPRFFFALFDQVVPRGPQVDPPEGNPVNTLVRVLQELTKGPREIHLGRTVEFFYRYEDQVRERALRPGVSPFLQAFHARLPLLALKIAGCYHLAEKGGGELAPETLAHAMSLVDYQARALEQTAATKWSLSRDGQDLERVREILRAEPGIVHGRLLKNSHLTAHRLQEILRTLRETGELRQEGFGKRGTPFRYTVSSLADEGSK